MPAFAPVTIAGLSRLSGVDVKVIRHYMAIGLLPPSRRRPGREGDRAFHREHLERLRFIVRGLALGFTLDAIGELIRPEGGYATCGDAYNVAQRTLSAIGDRDTAPSSTLARLIDACPRRGGPADCAILAELRRPD